MTLTWDAPSSDGGSPVIGYHVEKRGSDTKRWVMASKTTLRDKKLTVTDLIEETDYEFRVIAENKVGTGEPGNPSRPITAKDPWGKIILYFTITILHDIAVLK